MSDVQFPLWRKPNWMFTNEFGQEYPEPLNELSEELFDKNGKLVGLVKPYGSIYAAYIACIKAETSSFNYEFMGCYYDKEKAKYALEILFKIKY